MAKTDRLKDFVRKYSPEIQRGLEVYLESWGEILSQYYYPTIQLNPFDCETTETWD